ncbi:MbtH family protein [Streptomyces chartreusis]|uniref:MbtH family protein n=1 Tax=Streptomyces chartreusis TaxID=1969 RepID=UPI0037F1296F
MSTHPFEDRDGTYHVLVNAENQHSLWPTRITLPAGWEVALRDQSRDRCLEFIEKNWTDMRPKTLSTSSH